MSANGEAMFLWDGPVLGDAGGVVHQLEWLHYGTDWDPTPSLLATDASPVATAADASGNFFAVWSEPATGTVRSVRMARYARGVGWGTWSSGLLDGLHPRHVRSRVAAERQHLGRAGRPRARLVDRGEHQHRPLVDPGGTLRTRYGVGGRRVGGVGHGDAARVGGRHEPSAVGTDGSAALVWRQVGATASVYKTMVSTFSGTWSSPTALLAGTSSTATQTFSSVVGTDGRGTFLTAWTQRDNGVTGVYASRLAARSTAWGTPALLKGEPADAGTPTTQETGPQLAMGPTGDAVVAMREYDYTTGTYAIDVATYSPSAGWSSPTRLETDTNGLGPPLMDGCGNANTLVWTRTTDISVWSARQAHGGDWTTPARRDTSRTSR